MCGTSLTRPSGGSRAALLGLVLLAGCVPAFPGGPARAPRRSVPRDYGVAEEQTNTARTNWRAFFNNPRVAALVDTALENNQELNIAIQEILVLNNEVLARRGEYLPSLSFGAGAGLDRAGRYTSQGQSDERSGLAPNLQNYSLGLYASWELDLWGRLRNSASAAQLRYLASREGQHFLVTRLVAEIVSSYYELLALDRRLEILRTTVELQQRALEVVRVQQTAGRVTTLGVRRFEAQLLDWQGRQYELTQRVVEVENHLNFLLGRFPQHIDRDPPSFLAADPPVVHTGVPTQLFENRPDVRRAELELRAAELDVSAARARFYPSLRLDAGVGLQSFDLTRLFSMPDSILYNLFAGLAAPLLNRNGITAQYFSANSRQMQAVVTYERAILSAYIDVNTSLNLVRNLARSYTLKAQQVQHLAEAVDISLLLFNSARAEYLEVLTTRHDYLEAQLQLVELRQRQLSATVALYQALGGGWRPPERPAPAAQNASSGGSR